MLNEKFNEMKINQERHFERTKRVGQTLDEKRFGLTPLT